MIIAGINTVNYGSTGNIMLNILNAAEENGHTIYSYYGVGTDNGGASVHIGSRIENRLSAILAHLTGLAGCFSLFSTYYLIRNLKQKKVELVHLHNLHISFLNLPILFRFFKKNHIRVIWTLHDCWSFTGHCPHYTVENCTKWQTGCYECRVYHEYPISSFDNSRFMWKLKKKWFTGVENLTVVTPSDWLAEQVKHSFLKDYPVHVINNGIDLSVFNPTDGIVREQYNFGDRFILLGVALGWGYKKGLDVFLELARRLNPEEYRIVLVGTDEVVDKLLPENVVSVHRTNDAKELVEIYTSVDLFVNPTREDTYPTVNIEALACGTPVLTFKTGGSPEIPDEKTGAVVEYGDTDALERAIRRIKEERPFVKQDCLDRAQKFDKNLRFREYLKLYENR